MDDDSYRTIARESQIETKVKGSRFIGETRLVSDPEDALARLVEIRRREYSATHHCWAYRTGTEDPVAFKYSDDGEPSGTAGKPIFDVIAGDSLTNCLVVITRYFGGTKLGTGGLVRAYSDAARRVIDVSGVKTRYHKVRYVLEMDFTHYNPVQQLLNKLEADISDSQFTDRVVLHVAIRRSRAETLERDYVETTQGKASITRAETDGTD